MKDVCTIEYYIKEGKTQLEICKILGVSTGTVANRLKQRYGSIGFQKIRERLTGSRYTLSTKIKRSNISKRAKPTLVKTIDKNILESLILKDLHLKEVCKLLCVTDPTLNKFIKANYNCTFRYLREKITGEKVPKDTIDKLKNNIHFIVKSSDTCNIDGRLYLIKVYNDEEEFYKIGITRSTVYQRYISSTLKHFYKYKVEEEVTGNLLKLYYTEQFLKKVYCNYVYMPKHKFDGRTECFSVYVPISLL